MVLYENAEGNYRLIVECYLYVDRLEFVVKKTFSRSKRRTTKRRSR